MESDCLDAGRTWARVIVVVALLALLISHLLKTRFHSYSHDKSSLDSRCIDSTWANFFLSLFIRIVSILRNKLSAEMSSGSLVRNWARWMKSMLMRIPSYNLKIPGKERKYFNDETITFTNVLQILLHCDNDNKWVNQLFKWFTSFSVFYDPSQIWAK